MGGARVTIWNFIVMGATTLGVMHYVEIKSFTGFLVMFLILFVTTGIGNGSTFRMIPSIFRAEKLMEAKGLGDAARALALKAAGIESAAWLHIGDWRLWRIPHPARLRRLDCRHRRTQPGMGGLPDVLRHLRGANLAVLPAEQAAQCPVPRRSTCVRQG
jgi:hypothetical protein